MGSFFSTRWNGIRTRQDTGPLLKLDTADLRRRGALEPGTVSALEWFTSRGEPAGSIQLHTEDDALALIYRIREHSGEWRDVRERVDLETTPCSYGGGRRWFRCPRCRHRRRVLYCAGGRFRCRACQDLAYTSTRQDDMARCARRIAALHARLKAPRCVLFTIPPRPAHMKRTTYRRIVDELTREQDRYGEMCAAGLERIMRGGTVNN